MTGAVETVVRDAAAMETEGARFAGRCGGCVIFLQGELGAGKTTWVRGFLRGLGYREAVKSPTYMLMEHYQPEGGDVVHLDLYRLGNPEELEWLGLRDRLDAATTCLVEWPERGDHHLPQPDLMIEFRYHPQGRWIRVEAVTPRGRSALTEREPA